jgi:TPP-dependent pyruvate/acetoin dehydrogenase alpha subunit
VITAEDADRIADEVREEMQGAVDFGIDSPYPDPEDALKHVYA